MVPYILFGELERYNILYTSPVRLRSSSPSAQRWVYSSPHHTVTNPGKEGKILKIKQLKLEAALLLAVVMACSAPASTGLLAASAATTGGQVRLNVKSKTLKAGQKDYKLKLVNNKQKWKIQKVTTTNAAVCKAYGKKTTYVLLKGKKKGTATIRVKVTRSVTKNGKKAVKSKWLSCKVRVKQKASDTTATDTQDTPEVVNGNVTASDQAQLEAALKNADTRALRFETDAADTFTIPKADYKDIDLTVDAPNADVVNNGTFKSISVLAIKDETWIENAVGNILNVLAKAARVIVQPEANVSGITFAGPGAKVSLEVSGSVSGVSFAAADTNVKLAVAKSGRVDKVSMTAQAKSAKADLTVDGQVGNVEVAAPQADIQMSVAEGGTVNKMAVDAAADSAKVGLDVKGTVSDVSLDAQKADVSLAVNDNGKVDHVSVLKEMDVAVSGSAKMAVPVKVSAAAKITASVSIALESSVNVSIVLEKGAEGSSLKITGNTAAVGIKVDNRTQQNVTVSTPNGNYTVSEGSNRDITVNTPSASGGSSSGGSSSGGSSSGGSSSGGSSSGGSGTTGGETSGPVKGMILDHTDFTMKVGQIEEISVSLEPKTSGRLANIEWTWEDTNGMSGVIDQEEYNWETPDKFKVKANKPGVAVLSVTADIYGPEKDSAILLPNQTKSVIITVTEDGSTPEPAATVKMTLGASSIKRGETTELTTELESPADAQYFTTKFVIHSRSRRKCIDSNLAHTDKVTVKGVLKGKASLTAFSMVTLADGTQTVVAKSFEIEVTDEDAPNPEDVEPYFWLTGEGYGGSVIPIAPNVNYTLSVMDDPRAYGLTMEKVEWTSSDESVVKFDEKRFHEVTIVGLAEGKSTLTAEITYTTGPKTFTKKVSEEFTVKSIPDITYTANVVTGSAFGSSSVAVQITAAAPAGTTIKSVNEFIANRPNGLNKYEGSEGEAGSAANQITYVLINASQTVYSDVHIKVDLEDGAALDAVLKITIENNNGIYRATVERTRQSWTAAQESGLPSSGI